MARHRSRSAWACLLLASSALRVLASATPVIAAYWPAYSAKALPPAQLDFSVLTHVDYFVAVPDTNATLVGLDPTLATSFVKAAHASNVTVGLTLGGWTGSADFSSLVATDVSRHHFAQALMDAMKTYGFDGVEIDWCAVIF